MKPATILFWAARIVAALIMLQSLFFKFSASPESVYIFTTVGMEPWGRIGIGALELVATVLLFIPATIWLGAALAIGLMAGAIGMHVTLLGIEVQGDGGQLFIYALIVLLCSAYIFWTSRKSVPALLQKWLPSFLK
jgi:hypothetical protein